MLTGCHITLRQHSQVQWRARTAGRRAHRAADRAGQSRQKDAGRAQVSAGAKGREQIDGSAAKGSRSIS